MSEGGTLTVYDARLLRAMHEEVTAQLDKYAALNKAWPVMVDALMAVAYRVDAGAPYDGALLIARERARQIDEERYTARHDDDHQERELVALGVEPLLDKYLERDVLGDPWGLVLKHGDDEVRMLTICGALVAAELDRVLRARGVV